MTTTANILLALRTSQSLKRIFHPPKLESKLGFRSLDFIDLRPLQTVVLLVHTRHFDEPFDCRGEGLDRRVEGWIVASLA